MRVLFTGGSSFTGMWFMRALAEQGHSIVAATQGTEGSYTGLKAERWERLSGCCEFAWSAPFGTSAFLDVIARRGPFDVLCHHAAEVGDYKSSDFKISDAVDANTRGLNDVFRQLRSDGCSRVILSGSVFEANEGAGSMPMRAFSSYGLSKTLTAEIFSFCAEREGFALGKFVIANPFGPYDKPRFTEFLVRSWKEGRVAAVNTPRYVRDNIPVSLLAAVYARFATTLPPSGIFKINPSFYVESQGAFAQRFAREIGGRLEIEAELEFADQTEFAEPFIRINTDATRGADYGWDEKAAWDLTAQYYAERFHIPFRKR